MLHLDIDAFFVSAHRSTDVTLLNKPVAVGGRSNLKIFEKQNNNIKLYEKNRGAFVNPVFYNHSIQNYNDFFIDKNRDNKSYLRGIVTTCSYEAREFGVKTGMSLSKALQLCPSLVIIVPDYVLYHNLSHKLYSYLSNEVPSVEQFSIDEFFLDLNGWVRAEEVFEFARHLQDSVMDKFKIPVSIGISSSKWIAKLATNHAKPYGIKTVYKDDIASFIEDIPIKDFPGIGKGYSQKLEKHFICTLGEASRRKELFDKWGKTGRQLYYRIIGQDQEKILPLTKRKSIGISRTFDPVYDRKEILRRVMIMVRHVVYIVLKHHVNPTTYYLKLNYDYGFKTKGRKTVDRIFNENLCKNIYEKLLEELDNKRGNITKISIAVSNFSTVKKTFSLLEAQNDLREKKLSQSIHTLREKYSLDIVKNANEL